MSSVGYIYGLIVMTAPSSSCTHQSWRSGVTSANFSARKQQALVLLLTQQLMDAQFARADQAGSDRLWQEVGALEIDVDRILHLLYGGLDGSNRADLIAADEAWLQSHSTSEPRGLGPALSASEPPSPPRRRPQPCLSGIGISTAAGSGAQLSTR